MFRQQIAAITLGNCLGLKCSFGVTSPCTAVQAPDRRPGALSTTPRLTLGSHNLRSDSGSLPFLGAQCISARNLSSRTILEEVLQASTNLLLDIVV
jgi:hypothetical protein